MQNTNSERPGPGDHGRALMRHVDGVLAARGIAPTTWARQHGITATNLAKWREGRSDPSLATVVLIAHALDCRPVEIMIAARYVDASDMGITVYAPADVADVDLAIETDPRLNPTERGILRAARQMALAVRQGTIVEQSRIITP